MKITINYKGKQIEAEVDKEKFEKIDNERWRAKTGTYYITAWGGDSDIRVDYGEEQDEYNYNSFNYFETEEDAKLWSEMLGEKKYVPKEGDTFYTWNFKDGSVISDYLDKQTEPPSIYIPEIFLGSIHPTKEECEAWGEKYGELVKKYIK